MRGELSTVSSALDGIRQSLKVDGYLLAIESATPAGLSVTIMALPEACADCLAPPEVIKMIISGAVHGAYAPAEINLVLPTGTKA